MNSAETIALWNRCQELKRQALMNDADDDAANAVARDHWNTWADALIVERQRLENEKRWKCHDWSSRKPRSENAETQEWLNLATADFGEVLFSRAKDDRSTRSRVSGIEMKEDKVVQCAGRAIDFRGYVFPGPVLFNEAVFDGWVWFQDAKFYGVATFTSARFCSWAGFQKAKFFGFAEFSDVTFVDNAVFEDACFECEVRFDLSEFKLGNIRKAMFKGEASFFAISVNRGLLVDGVEFTNVPNFIQASFNEAPNINAGIVKQYWWRPVNALPNEDARYGALKRIAAQAQNHRAEHDFFVMEMHATPWRFDSALKKITGNVYSLLSDCGRSILLPMFWWTVNAIFFWTVYDRNASLATEYSVNKCDWSTDAGFSPAAFFAIINNFPGTGLFLKSKREDAVACIGGSLNSLWPRLDFIMFLQGLLAALFLFLFLLALRNHFRIR